MLNMSNLIKCPKCGEEIEISTALSETIKGDLEKELTLKIHREAEQKYKLEDKNQTNILEFDPRLRIYSYDESTMQRILLDESNK